MAGIGFSSIAALIAQRRLGESSSALARSSERLASGLRINRASDDAAGLAVATSLQAQARVYGQGYRNVNDAISALNIADGGLEQLSAITMRQKELAEQAANGALSLGQRRSLNAEANALQREYNRIVQTNDFNGLRLLNGSMSQFRVQAGYGLSGSLGLGIGNKLARIVGTAGFTQGQTLDSASVGGGGGLNNSAQAVHVDYNSDGIMDIIEATTDDASFTGGLGIYIGNSDGTFKAPVAYDAAVESVATSIAAGDINGDGRMDVILSTEGNVTVFVQRGGGVLSAVYSYLNGGTGGDTVLVDFNADGKLDLASASTNGLHVRLGNGDDSFKSAVVYASSGRSLQAGDVNGDGVTDLVTESGVFLGSGAGTFGSMLAVSSGGVEVTLADINADGAIDIVSDKTIRLGNNDGTFQAASTYYAPGVNVSWGLHQIATGDFDGDGNLDIGLTTATGLHVFLGKGDGSFSAGVTTAGDYSSLLVSDFNSDGVSDLFAGGWVDTGSYIYQGNATTSTGVSLLNINTAQGARDTLTLLEAQLARITGERAEIGSAQSRLSSTLNTLGSSRDNSLAAAHRITDVDVASEAAQLTRNRILQQIGASILAQANLIPDLALRLLKG